MSVKPCFFFYLFGKEDLNSENSYKHEIRMNVDVDNQ